MSAKNKPREAVLVPCDECYEICPVVAETSDGRKVVEWFLSDYKLEPEPGQWEVIGTMTKRWSWLTFSYVHKFTPFIDISFDDI